MKTLLLNLLKYKETTRVNPWKTWAYPAALIYGFFVNGKYYSTTPSMVGWSCGHWTLDRRLTIELFSCSVMSSSFVTPWIVAHQAPLSMGFLRQEYWSGLPFPSPGDLPNTEIEPMSPAWQADSLGLSYQGSPEGQQNLLCFQLCLPSLYLHTYLAKLKHSLAHL